MQTRITAKAVLFNGQGQILVLRRHPKSLNRPSQLDFPGGKLDPGEGITVGLVREIQEETGITVASADASLVFSSTEVQTKADGVPHNAVRLFFVAKTTATEVKLSQEHDQYQWLTLDEAIKIFDYPRQQAVLEYIRDNDLATP